LSYKIKRIVPVLCVAAALFATVLLPVSGHCENLRFVFLADSPIGNPPPNPQPTDLINTAVLTPIINQILALSPRPSFVVFGGDQATSGCYQGTYTFEAFKSVMAPLTDAGIALYTALGNRELFNPATPTDDTFYLANQTAYQAAFSSNPANGPPSGHAPSYEHLVYSFESPGGDAFFAVLDPYYLTADVPNPNLAGTFDDTQLNWLAAQVAQTKATHKFLFNHAPYYYVADGEGGGPDITYTKLWSILDNNHFNACFCAHIHLYSRKTIDSTILPNPQLTPPVQWHNNVVQVINGGAGAPLDTNPPYPPTVDNPDLWHISQTADTYYFTVVDINGSQVTAHSYGGNTGAYTIFDTFPSAVPAVNSLLLN
jgi:Calcineurin-like phosphoesterase